MDVAVITQETTWRWTEGNSTTPSGPGAPPVRPLKKSGSPAGPSRRINVNSSSSAPARCDCRSWTNKDCPKMSCSATTLGPRWPENRSVERWNRSAIYWSGGSELVRHLIRLYVTKLGEDHSGLMMRPVKHLTGRKSLVKLKLLYRRIPNDSCGAYSAGYASLSDFNMGIQNALLFCAPDKKGVRL